MIVVFSFILSNCNEKEEENENPIVVKHYNGDIEVLNSCGEQGAAIKMRAYLRQNGFDVISYGNDLLQNYDETILVLRNPKWEGAEALAKTLKTKNVMTVKSKRAVVDASVYIGKDLYKIIESKQEENNHE